MEVYNFGEDAGAKLLHQITYTGENVEESFSWITQGSVSLILLSFSIVLISETMSDVWLFLLFSDEHMLVSQFVPAILLLL